MTRDNQIKLADLGLARSYSPNEKSLKYSNPVVTLWYRSPELLFGLREYGLAIDIWSVGCVFAEMKCRSAVFKGGDESEQLNLIFDTCGSPVDDIQDLYKSYPKYNEFTNLKTGCPRILTQKFAMSVPLTTILRILYTFYCFSFIYSVGNRLGDKGLALLEAMLHLDPRKVLYKA